MKYKILDKKENILESRIEKSGIKTEFTIADLLEQIHSLKSHREMIKHDEAIHKARMSRVEEASPDIKELSNNITEELTRTFLDYFTSKIALTDAEASYKLIDSEVERYEKEIKDIEKCLEVNIPRE